jgi:hypothetical protein
MTPVNVLTASTALHDMTLLALDNNGNHYMASARSQAFPSFADNLLIKGPASTLIPLAYSVYDGYGFVEVATVQYVLNIVGTANGFNGIAVSPNFLYTYDGAALKKWNPNTGTLTSSVVVTATPYSWGGLAVDDCDNIYVGVQSSVNTYDVNLNLTGSIALSNTVYDIRLGPLNKLYAAGNGFVSEIQLTAPPCTSLNLSVSVTSSCPNGTAIANATGGTGPYTYSWSPSGQMTATATGLSSGTYYVTVIDNSCVPKVQVDSVVVPADNLTVNINVTNASCFSCNDGSAIAVVSGGSPGYTYTWTPSGGNAATASNLSPGNYTCCITDSLGCTLCSGTTVGSPTNINDIASDAGILTIYPNPFHSSTTIILSDNLPLQNLKLSIYDVVGNAIQKLEIISREIEISNLSPGIYLLSLEGIKTKVVRKLVVY